MNESLAIAIAILVFVVITIAKGVRLVAQGEEWVVERLGKYHATLGPGLNILIPYLDRVAYKLVTKDIILDVQEQEVITRDNAVILTNAIAFVTVTRSHSKIGSPSPSYPVRRRTKMDRSGKTASGSSMHASDTSTTAGA